MNRLLATLIWVFCSSCVITPIYAWSAAELATLTLKDAIEKTLLHNPQLHQFHFTRQGLLAQRENSALAPEFHVAMELENFAGSGETADFNRAEIAVALSSVIELGGKQGSRVALADARLSQFEQEKQLQTLDLLGDLTRSFIQLLSTQEELRLAGEAVALSEALFSAVQKRAQRGASSDAETMRAKAMLSQSNMQRESVQYKLERRKVSLARFWGETEFGFSSLSGDLFAFGQSYPFAVLYEKVKQSPALSLLASELRLKDAQVRLAQSQNRADLSWRFGLRHFEDSGDTGITIGLAVPLFAGSRNRGSVSSALAERDSVVYQQADRLLLLHDQLFSAYSLRQQFIEAYLQLKQQVIPDLEKALSITREAFDRGRLKYQDWIAAQQELLNTKQRLIEAATAALLNQAAIEQLTAEPLTR